MPSKAMIPTSDSQNPPALPPIKCSPDERPPVIITMSGQKELRDNAPTLAVKQPFDDDYECPFCFSQCSRNYCWSCKSSLLKDEQDDDINEPL